MKNDLGFTKHFKEIQDDRQSGKIKHLLFDILFIAIVATVAHCNAWVEIEEFAEERVEWFKKYLELPNGIPSHDTMERTFKFINPKQFEKCFIHWINEVANLEKGAIVSIDGKTMRGTNDKRTGRSAIHVVSAWASQNQLVLGQVKTNEKSNEITAIPELIDLLSLKDCIVTIDAMGTQRNIAEKIIEKGAEYVLALKENQGNLHIDVKDYFEFMLTDKVKDKQYDYFRKFEKGHGRSEIRHSYVVSDIDWLDNKEKWKELKSICMIKRECIIGDLKTIDVRFYISSMNTSAENFLNIARSHWGIESMHWSLDVTFKEDGCKVKKDNAPQNLAVLKRIALNLVKQETSSKKSLNLKRFKACMSTKYLEKILFGM